MREYPESDDMISRPGWRYIEWRGWNLLALGWLLLGIVVALVTNVVCAHRLRDVQHNGTVAIAAGVSVIAADLLCRWRDPEPSAWRRYVSAESGGAVLFIPAWLIAFWVVVGGIVTMAGKG
jgi:hypothetical protein